MRVGAWIGAALLCGVAPAAEAADWSVLVLPVEQSGFDAQFVKDLDRVARERVKAAMPEASLMPAPALGVPDLLIAAGCAKASYACFAGIGRTVGATDVIRIQLEGTPKRANLIVTRVRVANKRGSKHEAKLQDFTVDAVEAYGWHVEKGAGGDPAPLTGRIKLLTAGGLGSLEGAELLLDDAKITRPALDTLVPGEHHLIIKQTGFESVHWRGRIEGGRTETVRVEFTPEKKAAPPPPPPPVASAPPPTEPPITVTGPVDDEPEFGLFYTLIFGTLTAVSGAAIAYFGLKVLDLEKDTEAMRVNCVMAPTTPICEDGEQTEAITNVAIGVTAAFGIATIVALVLEWPDGSEPGMDEDGTELSLGVAPTGDGAAAAMMLRF